MKIHTGDTVLVISGKDKGKQGTVMRVLSLKNRLIVEGINMRVRHIKKTTQQPGQRIKYEASLAASNVMLLDPKTKKPTRVGYRIDAKTGKKVRFAKVSGEVLPTVSTVKGAQKATKGTKAIKDTKAAKGTKGEEGRETKETKEVKEEKGTAVIEKVEAPKKQPFWKRAFSGPASNEGVAPSGPEEAGHGPVTPVRRSRESS